MDQDNWQLLCACGRHTLGKFVASGTEPGVAVKVEQHVRGIFVPLCDGVSAHISISVRILRQNAAHMRGQLFSDIARTWVVRAAEE